MSVWTRAVNLAGQTPAKRNRAVDFYRALAIVLVVSAGSLVLTPSTLVAQPQSTTNTAGFVSHISTVDSAGGVHTSIAIGSDGRAVIGRGGRSDVVVPDAYPVVSRQHLVVESAPALPVRLTDVSSFGKSLPVELLYNTT